MKKILEYLKPMVITVFLFTIIFIVLGVAPFGNKSIIHYDMGLQTYPVFTMLYDVLHGERGLFYNFNIGGGVNSYAVLLSNGLFSLFNWIIALVSRKNVPIMICWMVVLKFSLISLTTYYSLKQIFPKLEKKWILVGALLNTFSSYSLLYYINFQWIECWALFPLIVLGLKNIFDKKSSLLFTITLTLCLLISFYMSWLILLIIIFGGTWALFKLAEKKDRRQIGSRILFNIVISLLISFISFYPAFSFSMNSYRIVSSSEFLNDMNPISFKMLHIFTCPILIFYVIKMILNYKNDSKKTGFYIGLLVITLIPLFIDPINAMWHTGSYSGLPFRFGFIVVFIMICSMLHYIEIRKINVKEQNPKKVKIAIVFMLILLIGNVIFNINTIQKTDRYQFITGETGTEKTKDIYVFTTVSVMIGILILFLTAEIYNEKIQFNMLIILFIINSLFLIFLYFKTLDEFSFDLNQKESSVFYIENIYESFYNENTVYKVKDEDSKFINNYAYVLKMNTIENWIHIIPERQVNSLRKLGYSYNKLLQYDNGGTLISDIVLGVNSFFSTADKDEKVYKLIKEKDDMKYYEYNFENLNLFKIYKDSDFVSNFINKDFKIENVFETQNKLYNTFFDTDEDIIKIKENSNFESIEKSNEKNLVTENSNINYKFNLEEKSDLYVYAYNLKNCDLKIKINGEEYKEKEFSEKFNGILNLGIFDVGEINIDLNFEPKIKLDELNKLDKEQKETVLPTFDKIEVGVLNIEKLLDRINKINTYEEQVIFENNSFNATVNSNEENNSLFIPINYDEGWSATVNGKNVEITPALATYMSIPLENGINEIQFKYFPSNLKISIIITVISIGVYIIMINVRRNIDMDKSKVCKVVFNVQYVLFLIFVIAFVFAIYLKPLLKIFFK